MKLKISSLMFILSIIPTVAQVETTTKAADSIALKQVTVDADKNNSVLAEKQIAENKKAAEEAQAAAIAEANAIKEEIENEQRKLEKEQRKLTLASKGYEVVEDLLFAPNIKEKDKAQHYKVGKLYLSGDRQFIKLIDLNGELQQIALNTIANFKMSDNLLQKGIKKELKNQAFEDLKNQVLPTLVSMGHAYVYTPENPPFFIKVLKDPNLANYIKNNAVSKKSGAYSIQKLIQNCSANILFFAFEQIKQAPVTPDESSVAKNIVNSLEKAGITHQDLANNIVLPLLEPIIKELTTNPEKLPRFAALAEKMIFTQDEAQKVKAQQALLNEVLKINFGATESIGAINKFLASIMVAGTQLENIEKTAKQNIELKSAPGPSAVPLAAVSLAPTSPSAGKNIETKATQPNAKGLDSRLSMLHEPTKTMVKTLNALVPVIQNQMGQTGIDAQFIGASVSMAGAIAQTFLESNKINPLKEMARYTMASPTDPVDIKAPEFKSAVPIEPEALKANTEVFKAAESLIEGMKKDKGFTSVATQQLPEYLRNYKSNIVLIALQNIAKRNTENPEAPLPEFLDESFIASVVDISAAVLPVAIPLVLDLSRAALENTETVTLLNEFIKMTQLEKTENEELQKTEKAAQLEPADEAAEQDIKMATPESPSPAKKTKAEKILGSQPAQARQAERPESEQAVSLKADQAKRRQAWAKKLANTTIGNFPFIRSVKLFLANEQNADSPAGVYTVISALLDNPTITQRLNAIGIDKSLVMSALPFIVEYAKVFLDRPDNMKGILDYLIPDALLEGNPGVSAEASVSPHIQAIMSAMTGQPQTALLSYMASNKAAIKTVLEKNIKDILLAQLAPVQGGVPAVPAEARAQEVANEAVAQVLAETVAGAGVEFATQLLPMVMTFIQNHTPEIMEVNTLRKQLQNLSGEYERLLESHSEAELTSQKQELENLRSQLNTKVTDLILNDDSFMQNLSDFISKPENAVPLNSIIEQSLDLPILKNRLAGLSINKELVVNVLPIANHLLSTVMKQTRAVALLRNPQGDNQIAEGISAIIDALQNPPAGVQVFSEQLTEYLANNENREAIKSMLSANIERRRLAEAPPAYLAYLDAPLTGTLVDIAIDAAQAVLPVALNFMQDANNVSQLLAVRTMINQMTVLNTPDNGAAELSADKRAQIAQIRTAILSRVSALVFANAGLSGILRSGVSDTNINRAQVVATQLLSQPAAKEQLESLGIPQQLLTGAVPLLGKCLQGVAGVNTNALQSITSFIIKSTSNVPMGSENTGALIQHFSSVVTALKAPELGFTTQVVDYMRANRETLKQAANANLERMRQSRLVDPELAPLPSYLDAPLIDALIDVPIDVMPNMMPLALNVAEKFLAQEGVSDLLREFLAQWARSAAVNVGEVPSSVRAAVRTPAVPAPGAPESPALTRGGAPVPPVSISPVLHSPRFPKALSAEIAGIDRVSEGPPELVLPEPALAVPGLVTERVAQIGRTPEPSVELPEPAALIKPPLEPELPPQPHPAAQVVPSTEKSVLEPRLRAIDEELAGLGPERVEVKVPQLQAEEVSANLNEALEPRSMRQALEQALGSTGMQNIVQIAKPFLNPVLMIVGGDENPQVLAELGHIALKIYLAQNHEALKATLNNDLRQKVLNFNLNGPQAKAGFQALAQVLKDSTWNQNLLQLKTIFSKTMLSYVEQLVNNKEVIERISQQMVNSGMANRIQEGLKIEVPKEIKPLLIQNGLKALAAFSNDIVPWVFEVANAALTQENQLDFLNVITKAQSAFTERPAPVEAENEPAKTYQNRIKSFQKEHQGKIAQLVDAVIDLKNKPDIKNLLELRLPQIIDNHAGALGVVLDDFMKTTAMGKYLDIQSQKYLKVASKQVPRLIDIALLLQKGKWARALSKAAALLFRPSVLRLIFSTYRKYRKHQYLAKKQGGFKRRWNAQKSINKLVNKAREAELAGLAAGASVPAEKIDLGKQLESQKYIEKNTKVKKNQKQNKKKRKSQTKIKFKMLNSTVRYSLTHRDFRGLIFKSDTSFNNYLLDGFNFKGAKLNSSFENAEIRNCNFDKVVLGGEINFNGLTIDNESFNTLLPAIDAYNEKHAKQPDKQINTSSITVIGGYKPNPPITPQAKASPAASLKSKPQAKEKEPAGKAKKKKPNPD